MPFECFASTILNKLKVFRKIELDLLQIYVLLDISVASSTLAAAVVVEFVLGAPAVDHRCKSR